MITRRQSIMVRIGGIPLGSQHSVVVQSMTNTDTSDVEGTVDQIRQLADAGSELVRVTVNNEQAAKAIPEIVRRLEDLGCPVPIIGDFHYNGHLLLTQFPACAKKLSKYRINPGNVGMGKHRDSNFQNMIEVALDNDKPIRIGVNWGSLDQALLYQLMEKNAEKAKPDDANKVLMETIVESALRSAQLAEQYGLPSNRIVLSAKVSKVPDLIRVYRDLGNRCQYPLHLGLTEAGMGTRGIVASAAGLAVLLMEGIGDTIRVSLTPQPGGDRTKEVRVAQQVLQAAGIRSFTPEVSACPGCGRTTSNFFQKLARDIQSDLDSRMQEWKNSYPGIETLKVAVMGCVVNGPGESKHADIGISLPGTGESPKAPVYVDGRHFKTLRGSNIAEQFHTILEDYVEKRFGST